MVGIAVLGAGIFAREAHVPALIANKAHILAVYSRSTKSAESLIEAVRTGGGAYTSTIDVYSEEKKGFGVDELLQRADIQAVVVALPIVVQSDVVRKCLAAGKHILAEKPIAKDVSTGEKLVTDYEQTYKLPNRVFSVAEQFRYDLGFARARAIVSSGEIGDLVHVHARVWGNIQPGAKYYETEWRKHPEYQGGFILDGGVHFVALVRTVSGQEIVETRGMGTQHASHLPPVDTINSALRFSGGATGSLSFSFASTKSAFEFMFVGSKGSLTITNAENKRSKLSIENAETKDQREETLEGKSMDEEIKAFIDAIETGTPDPYGSPREALADVAVVESICSGGGLINQHTL